MPSRLISIMNHLRSFVIFALFLQLVACAALDRQPAANVSAGDYRKQAAKAIREHLYADGAQLLNKAVKLDPTGADYFLLGNLQEALEKYRKARKSYQMGLEFAVEQELQQKLNFNLATVEALAFNRFEKAAELISKLPANSAASFNLQALQAMQLNHYDKALRLTEQAISNTRDQEMIGWAHFLAARCWAAVNNDSKAFQSLFFAINHARAHGLVSRVTRFWEELKLRPLPQ